MTLSKSALTISSLAMAMLFGGGVYLLMNMNIIAKNYIEREASKTLGVSVSLGGLDISLQDRTAKVTNLVIGNPEGFEKPFSIKVKGISVVLGSVSNQLVQFKDVDVDGSEVNLEVRENITNLAAIKNRIKVTPPDPNKEPLKVIIDKLTVSQAQIKPGEVLFTEEELQPVTVPDIVLTGVGQKENGVLVNEAIAQIFTHIAHKLNTQALQSGLLQGMDEDALKDMGLGFTQRFQENLKQNVNEKMDKLNDSISGFFNE